MAYNPTIWKDRAVEKPRTYTIQNNPDGTVTLIPAPGAIVEPGTPVNAANMNKLEQGLKTHEADYAKSDWTLIKFNTVISVPNNTQIYLDTSNILSLKNDFMLNEYNHLTCVNPGTYEFYLKISFSKNGSGERRLVAIQRFNSDIIATDVRKPVLNDVVFAHIHTIDTAVSGQRYRIYVQQDSGVSLNVPAFSVAPGIGYMWIRRVRND